MKVEKRSGKIVEFDNSKIIKAVKKAFNAIGNEIPNEKISIDLLNFINENIKEDVKKVEDIQDSIVEWLHINGHHKVGIAFTKYRERRAIARDTSFNSVNLVNEYLSQLDDMAVHENSSTMYSLQGLNNHIFSEVSEKYWLSLYSDEIKNAFNSGRIHIHDLNSLSAYCCGWDLKALLTEGFGGVSGKPSSKPPKHLSSALNQANNFIFTLQGEAAGAMAFSNFNTLLAPFVREDNLSYNQVKQEIQQFIYNLNISTRVCFQCLSEDTEILSEKGWVKYDDIKEKDKIATFNMKSHSIEHKEVQNIFKEQYDGNMILISDESGYNQLVTPNHRVIISNGDDGFLFKNAIDIYNDKADIWVPIIATSDNGNMYVNCRVIFKEEIQTVDYSGIVWCPTTENGTVIARRNGKCFITGNSPFSNITLDLDTTKVKFADEPVVIGGELKEYSYGDCNKEATWINQAVVEVLSEGDAVGAMLSYPIVTFNVTKDFPWQNKLGKTVLEATSKYGSFYWANYINSDYAESDITSMAIMPNQNIIYRNDNGVSKGIISKIYKYWNESKERNKNLEVLWKGEFIPIIEMFKIDYSEYDKIVDIELENGILQTFSMKHKCHVLRDGVAQMVYSENLDENTDSFLLSNKNWENTTIGEYVSGKILGYYFGDGYSNIERNVINFSVNINKLDVIDDIERFFNNLGLTVKKDERPQSSVTIVSVYGKFPVSFIKDFIVGNKAKDKNFTYRVWNTSIEFRRGILDGIKATDGHMKTNIVTHTTSKDVVDNIITLMNSIGLQYKLRINKNNTRYFKPDKSDLVKFTSYELKEVNCYTLFGDMYVVPIKSVTIKNKRKNLTHVYNFTVDTPEHLYELPNGIITEQCCRLKIDRKEIAKHLGEYTGGLSENEYEKTHQKGHGFFGASPSTGSIGVVTLNIPAIMHDTKEANGDWDRFLQNVKYYMDLAMESLMKKRKIVEDKADKGLYPYLTHYLRDVKKRTGHYFTQHFSTICPNGVHEALYIYGFKDGIMCEDGLTKAIELLKYMNEYTIQLQKENRVLVNLEQAPAESAGVKLCKKSGIDPLNNGYYTNSTWQPAESKIDLIDLIDMQGKLNVYYSGGSSMHTYTDSDLVPIAQDLQKIIMYAFTETKIPYMTISPVFSVCEKCGRIAGKHHVCPKCGSKKIEIYERIVGYYRPHTNWNKGRLKESEKRNYLKLNPK